jgi:hypothetical protein
MFLTLGLAGTFVAVIGMYGVRSYLVSRRIREFGVRLGAGQALNIGLSHLDSFAWIAAVAAAPNTKPVPARS